MSRGDEDALMDALDVEEVDAQAVEASVLHRVRADKRSGTLLTGSDTQPAD